jgi:hypothetical protein
MKGKSMTTRPIMLNLPESLYEQIRQRAEEKQHSIETELIEVVTSSMPVADELTPDITQAVAGLAVLDDKMLEEIARNPMAKKKQARIQSLHLKRQRDGLSETETQLLAGLMKEYDRAFLVRVNAIEILRQRGHDISRFF